jgi:carbamoyl-phosphate synthase large subunit
LADLDDARLRRLEADGFSDRVLAFLLGTTEGEVRAHRHRKGIRPVFKRVDTCAAEFEAYTPYLYSSYEDEDEAPPTDRKKVIILGSGPIRIGQGIEFDYCCVHAVFALRAAGYETVMVNCNPETGLHRLRHLGPPVLRAAHPRGRAGDRPPREAHRGHRPVRRADAAAALGAAGEGRGCPSSGPRPDAIDRAEDRERFREADREAGAEAAGERGSPGARTRRTATAQKIGYPVMVRPSYVLGGRAMEVVYDAESLERYMREAVKASPEHPRPHRPLPEGRLEVDLDLVADRTGEVLGGGSARARRGGGDPLRRCIRDAPAALRCHPSWWSG